MIWNKAKIEELLKTNDKAVERAIIAIYDRQTQDEKQASDTKHTNHRGFRANHASKGSYYARWVLGGRRLTGDHLANARKIALHYTSQLLDVTKNKEVASKPALAAPTNSYVGIESQIIAFMKRYPEESRKDTERIVRNIAAGRCADGCCGGDD